LEVSPHEEWVLVWGQLATRYHGEQPTEDFDGDSRDVEREKIDNLIHSLSSRYEIPATEKLQDFDELIGGEVAIVEVFLEVVDDSKEVLLEELIS
jgi:hypothetical protein